MIEAQIFARGSTPVENRLTKTSHIRQYCSLSTIACRGMVRAYRILPLVLPSASKDWSYAFDIND